MPYFSKPKMFIHLFILKIFIWSEVILINNFSIEQMENFNKDYL